MKHLRLVNGDTPPNLPPELDGAPLDALWNLYLSGVEMGINHVETILTKSLDDVKDMPEVTLLLPGIRAAIGSIASMQSVVDVLREEGA